MQQAQEHGIAFALCAPAVVELFNGLWLLLLYRKV